MIRSMASMKESGRKVCMQCPMFKVLPNMADYTDPYVTHTDKMA